MCIAITKPAGVKPDYKAYQNGYDRNPDGWGFAVPDRHKKSVIIRKNTTSFKDFWKQFKPFRDRPALVHFRIKTHGVVEKRNCHPFRVGSDLAMIHNGQLDIECNEMKDKSDTWHFVKQVLRPMYDDSPIFPWNAGCQFIAEQYIDYNKCAFLHADGDFAWWNKEAGHEVKDGHWYSNKTYEEPKAWPPNWAAGYYTAKSKTVSSSDTAKYNDHRGGVSEWDTSHWSYDDDQFLLDADDAYPVDKVHTSEAQYNGNVMHEDDAAGCQILEDIGVDRALIEDMWFEDPMLIECLAKHYKGKG
jgi:hypothetical protein